MQQYQTVLKLQTPSQSLSNITRQVDLAIAESGIQTGLCTLFLRHTSASLIIQENADPDVQTDLQAFFRRLVPPASDPSMGYLRHTLEGADDMPAHIKAAMMPVTLSIPVVAGR
ncbi:MAG: secondary thiamine-phosphate synthase enzyme YjbQ, partial [Cyanobacteria bacterium P01_H01_bin.121]